MGTVPEISTIEDNFTGGQLDILVLNADEIAVLAKLRLVEVGDGNTKFGETNEFLSVETGGVSEDTTSINNGDSLV